MSAADQTRPIREAVGYFDDATTLQAAIDELMTSGFDRAEISLLASEQAVEHKLGHIYNKVAELEDDPKAARTFYISNESVGAAEGALIGTPLYVAAAATGGIVLATGGTMAAAILGAALAGGAGGLIGGVFAKLFGDQHAHHLQEQLDHGGLLLWVRTRDEPCETQAAAIMKSHSGHDVHIHTLAAST